MDRGLTGRHSVRRENLATQSKRRATICRRVLDQPFREPELLHRSQAALVACGSLQPLERNGCDQRETVEQLGIVCSELRQQATHRRDPAVVRIHLALGR